MKNMKSTINGATFTKRIPTEQYGFEEYSLSGVVDDSETGADVLVEMRKQVSEAFAADLVEATEKKEETKASKKAAKTTPKKEEKKNVGKSKARPVDDEDEDGEDSELEDQSDDGEGVEDDEAADGEDGDDDHDSADDSEDEEGSDGDDADEDQEEGGEDEPEEKPAKKAGKGGKQAAEKSGGKKVFKKRPQAYNRQLDQHKDIFGRVLRSVNPEWSKDAKLKVKAKQCSEDLEGEDFLDENGEVLPAFKAEVKKRMTGKSK